jgi:hypothetical protein
MPSSIRTQLIQELKDLGMETEDASLVDPLVDRLLAAAKKEMRLVVSCVYCGQQYPQGTPASHHETLTTHIAQCGKHPMRGLLDALHHILKCTSIGDAKILASAAISELPLELTFQRSLDQSMEAPPADE